MKVAKIIVTLLLTISNSDASCNVCHNIDDTKINIHIIPHSHVESGWVKTLDEYYYYDVQFIFDSVIQSLALNTKRRFIVAEVNYFWKWWQSQEQRTKDIVLNLVNTGRLEFVNGAWTTNDEAVTNYHSIIDQFTWGLRIINDTLGSCARPKIGWMIDSFGHSKQHAFINSQMGFEAIILSRLDYREHTKRIEEKDLEFLWESSDDSYLFTSVFPFVALNMSFFEDVIVDDPSSPIFNLPQKMADFTNLLVSFQNSFKTQNVMFPVGGNFTYEGAEKIFKNLDKIVRSFESHDTYNVIYSTPWCYVQAVKKSASHEELQLSKKSDDFFPYATDSDVYWTGFFTSRPNFKRLERISSNILHGVEQLLSFSKVMNNDREDSIAELREVLGIIQHHNAITGTEKQYVVEDYRRLLMDALATAEEPLGVIIGNLLEKEFSIDVDLNLKFCILVNTSICETSLKERFIVVAYNPLSRYVNSYIRLPIDFAEYRISGPDGEEIYDIFASVYNNPSLFELVFLAKDLPPLGLKLYYVEKLEEKQVSRFRNDLKDVTKLGTEKNGITVVEGKLKQVKINGLEYDVEHEFLYYLENKRRSGAYVFSTSHSFAYHCTLQKIIYHARIGTLVDELVQIFNSDDCKITQIIRVYKGIYDSYIEFDWLISELTPGRELISRFHIKNFENEDVFYTDSNGRNLIRRFLNQRDFVYDPRIEPVSSNYYPVTSRIVIRDVEDDIEAVVLNDRGQGGSVLENGVIEFLVHRRLRSDDGFGIGEVLDDSEQVRGSHWFTIGPKSTKFPNGMSISAFEKQLQHEKYSTPLILLADASGEELNKFEFADALFTSVFKGLQGALPNNVKLLSLEPWNDDDLLLRLEHIFEEDEDDLLSEPVVVAGFSQLFNFFETENIRETTLGGNQWLNEYVNEDNFTWIPESKKYAFNSSNENVLLKPMQIRTFLVKIKRNDSGVTTEDTSSVDSVSSESFIISISLICGIVIYY